jgi:hypothetical protein
MDVCDEMNFTPTAHRCRLTVAHRCIVAQSPKRCSGQPFSPQRCPVRAIVATHRCSDFIVADRCTVAESRNLAILKGTGCNDDRCSSSLIATPLSLERGSCNDGKSEKRIEMTKARVHNPPSTSWLVVPVGSLLAVRRPHHKTEVINHSPGGHHVSCHQ